MKLPAKPEAKAPFFIMQFYHSQTFPYLIEKWDAEISRRLKDIPVSLRHQELVPALVALGEASGDTAWQVFRNYLDKVEHCLAEIIRCHSPSFWFHLHRRLRPMLSDIHEGKKDDTTVASPLSWARPA